MEPLHLVLGVGLWGLIVSWIEGYWTAELGGLNQVVHIWKYGKYHTISEFLDKKDFLDSYQHRASVRAKLGGDPEWQAEYFQKILPWLQHQDNCTLRRLR